MGIKDENQNKKSIIQIIILSFIANILLISCGDDGPAPPPPRPFVTVWKVGDADFGDGSNSITLPLRNEDTVLGVTYEHNFTVDWGDGESDEITAFDDAAITHTYDNPGDYTVRINGTLEAWNFTRSDSTDNNKLIRVSSLGDMNWKTLEEAFEVCEKLTSFRGTGDTSGVVEMNSIFLRATLLNDIDISGFNTAQVTDMSYMFFGAAAITELDLSHFNTSKVVSTAGMFSGATNLVTLDISGFDTTQVENLIDMFKDTSNLTTLHLPIPFEVPAGSYMKRMFSGASSLTSLNLVGFTPRSVGVTVGSMFKDMTALTDLNVSDWGSMRPTSSANIFDGTDDVVVTCTETELFYGKTCIVP